MGAGSPGASGLGSKAHLSGGLVAAQPACALILLARSAVQEIKQEQKELREEQKITKATLKQLITADQLQERVRFGGSTPAVVLNGRLLLAGFLATFPAWSGPFGHQLLLAASILSQYQFLLPFLQLNELRAMMGTVGQQQGQSPAPCPERIADTKLVRKLLHRCERLQQQVDSLMPPQVDTSLPQKTQVGRWQHGEEESVSGPSVCAHSNTEQPLANSQFGLDGLAVWQEIKALIQMSGWH